MASACRDSDLGDPNPSLRMASACRDSDLGDPFHRLGLGGGGVGWRGAPHEIGLSRPDPRRGITRSCCLSAANLVCVIGIPRPTDPPTPWSTWPTDSPNRGPEARSGSPGPGDADSGDADSRGARGAPPSTPRPRARTPRAPRAPPESGGSRQKLAAAAAVGQTLTGARAVRPAPGPGNPPQRPRPRRCRDWAPGPGSAAAAPESRSPPRSAGGRSRSLSPPGRRACRSRLPPDWADALRLTMTATGYSGPSRRHCPSRRGPAPTLSLTATGYLGRRSPLLPGPRAHRDLEGAGPVTDGGERFLWPPTAAAS